MTRTSSRAPMRTAQSLLDDAGATVAGLFVERCRSTPRAIAYAYKELGLWREVTYAELADQVGAAAAALRAAGLGAGDRIAFMGDALPPFFVLDLATQLLGGISYALYPTTGVADVSYLLRHGGAKIFVAEHQEYVDKLLDVQEPFPDLHEAVVIDSRGMFDYDEETVIAWDRFLAKGGTPLSLDELESMAAALDADAGQFIFYTSGTTGRPKGAVLSHRNIISAWAGFFTVVDAPHGGDRLVVDLPLAHIGGRTFGLLIPVMFGCVPHFAESIDALGEAKVEVSPTMAFGTPRAWERQASQISVGIETSSRLKRVFFNAAVAVRRRRIDKRTSTVVRAALLPLDLLLHHVAVRPVLDELGCTDLRFCVVGGAAIPEDVSRFWQLMGIEFNELYGATETSGVATVQDGAHLEPGVLGRALPGTEFLISPDGEILLRGPNVFKGYWNDSAATEAAIDGEWLHTGDAGELLADGSLRVLDRQKNLIVTSDGARVHPAEIENALKASTYVSDVILLGDSRPFLAALVEIDFHAVSEWARNHHVVYTSFTNLASRPEIVQLLEAEVERTNVRLARKGLPAIERMRILPKELDPESGEVTPTRKIKRRYIEEQFGDLVAEIYASDGASH